MEGLEYLLAAALGVSLAAAAGLRVFLPLLAAAVAARAGLLELSPGLDWVTGWPAIAALGVAAVLEVVAYYLPGVDQALDVLAGPLALVAGALLVVAPLWDLPPLVKWTTAIVAGGGAAALTQSLSSLLRLKSTLTTGGLANPVVATGELGGSLLLSALALLLPLVGLAAVMLVLMWVVRRIWRGRRVVQPAR